MSFPRYAEVKDSGVEWLGDVPAHWAPTRLRFLLRDGSDGLKIGPFGSQLTSEMLDESGAYKVYGQENVIANDFSKGSRYIGEEKFKDLSVYEICSEDLLITMMGTSGRCDVVPSDIAPGIMDSHLLRMRVRKATSPAFVRLLIDEAQYVANQVRLAGKGSIMHGLNSSIIKDLLLLIPPMAEQSRILDFLDRETAKIDALVAEQEKLIALLKEKRQAVISHAVTRGLNPDAPMKDSGIEWLGEVPAHWDCVPMKYLVRLQSGGTPSKDRLDYWEGSIPWASAKDMKLDVLADTEDHITDLAVAEHAASVVDPGTVLVVVRGMILARIFPVALTAASMAINQDLKGVVCGEHLRPEFLAWYFRGTASESLCRLDEAGHGTKALRMDAWTSLEIALPPLEEQIEIASFIVRETGRLDKLTAEANKAVTLLIERRSALISAAVTGKIDVTCVAVADSVTAVSTCA